MKPFAKYLAESERTYQYRIKVVGDIPPGFFKSFEEKMDQFDGIGSLLSLTRTSITIL